MNAILYDRAFSSNFPLQNFGVFVGPAESCTELPPVLFSFPLLRGGLQCCSSDVFRNRCGTVFRRAEASLFFGSPFGWVRDHGKPLLFGCVFFCLVGESSYIPLFFPIAVASGHGAAPFFFRPPSSSFGRGILFRSRASKSTFPFHLHFFFRRRHVRDGPHFSL